MISSFQGSKDSVFLNFKASSFNGVKVLRFLGIKVSGFYVLEFEVLRNQSVKVSRNQFQIFKVFRLGI
jgi:hypothetical protein